MILLHFRSYFTLSQTGAGEGNCTLCNKYEIFPTDVNEVEQAVSQTRSCVDECPRDYTHQVKLDNLLVKWVVNYVRNQFIP